MIYINIEIHKPNGFKELLHKIHSKLEDIIFSIFTRLPKKFTPKFLMIWMEQYTDKRLRELQQDVIRNRWHTIELEKAVEHIHDMQQD